MPPLLCHVWLRPSLSVRNEKGTRFTLGIAQMRFCRVTCWKKFTLNLQQKHRSPQMWYGGSTKLFQVSKEVLLHGERALMEFWVVLLWTSDVLELIHVCGQTAPRESALVVTWTSSSTQDRQWQYKLSRNTQSAWHSSRLLVFWTSVANRHVSWAHSSQKYMVVTRFRQTQKLCWQDCETWIWNTANRRNCLAQLPWPTILHRWNHQNTSCTVEWWDDSSIAVPIEETLLSGSISYAVVFNPRQWVTCRHCGNLHVTSKGLCTKIEHPPSPQHRTQDRGTHWCRLGRSVWQTQYHRWPSVAWWCQCLFLGRDTESDCNFQWRIRAVCYERRSGGGVGSSRAPHRHWFADNSTTSLWQYSSHGNCNTPRSWSHETRAGTRSCVATVDCRWPSDLKKRLLVLRMPQTFSRNMCHRMYSSPSSRNSVFYRNHETTRLLECCMGMWTDGRNGAPVYWLNFVTIGMRLLSAMCSVRHERSAL